MVKESSAAKKVENVTGTEVLDYSLEMGQKALKKVKDRITNSEKQINWELLIGGQWLNRIGAFAVIIGLIFFIKYAFDHNLINNVMKVTLVGLIGCLLSWGGRYFYRKQLPVFAQGLIGTGVASLYLAVYAANNVYGLIGGTLAFCLMFLITFLAFQQALTYNALSISLLGWVGGYLTPFFVSVDSENTFGLFSYLLILSLGMIFISIKKQNWSILYYLSLMATYLIFFLNFSIQSNSSEQLLYISFLVVNWAIFYGYELYFLIRQSQWPFAKEMMASIHSLILFVGLVFFLQPNYSAWILEGLFLAGMAYLLPLVVLSWRKKLSRVLKNQVIRYGITFSVFCNLAPLYHWERFELILVWVIQAALLLGWATQKRLRWLTIYTLGFLNVITLGLLILSFQFSNDIPILNLEFLSYLGITGVFLYGAIKEPRSSNLRHVFHVSWATIFFIGFSIEITVIKDYIQHLMNDQLEVTLLYGLVLFTSWILYSLFLTRIGIRKQIRSLTMTSWVFLAMGIVLLGTVALIGLVESFLLIFLSRILFLSIALVAIYFHYRRYRKSDPTIASICLYAGIFLGFELITLSIKDYFSYLFAELNSAQLSALVFLDKVTSLDYAKWVSYWMAWIVYVLFIFVYGWKRKLTSLMNSATTYFYLCILGILIHGLSFEPISQFVPIWNFRFLMIFVAVLVSYQLHRFYQKSGDPKLRYLFTLILLVFQCTFVEIKDYFQYRLEWSSTSSWEAQLIEFTRPLSFSTLLVLFSYPLMWLSLKHRRKWMGTLSWVALGTGLFFVMVFGIEFYRIAHFTPFFNWRSFFLIFVAAILMVYLIKLRDQTNVRWIYSILITILLFEFITVELNDLFQLMISQDPHVKYELLNLRQLSFSTAWIIYAILLFAIGLWRKFPILRWIAIGLFGVSIFKIFLYDLAFLDTLYRIFLFIGLGVILLLISYIYQRYKHLFTSNE